MTTHTTEESEMCRLCWISGSARTTIVVSTAVISTPVITTAIASTRCGWPALVSTPDAFSRFPISMNARFTLADASQPAEERARDQCYPRLHPSKRVARVHKLNAITALVLRVGLRLTALPPATRLVARNNSPSAIPWKQTNYYHSQVVLF